MPEALSPKAPNDRVFRIPFDGPDGALPPKEVVGSKAYNLMRMARRRLPVPPGFVLSTEFCRDYLREGPSSLNGIEHLLRRELDHLGALTGRYFGDARRPLLVSVRSGAAVSMPGMMETVLNIGLTETTLRGLVRMTGNPRLGQDCRLRLVQQYSEVVHGIAPSRFRDARLAHLPDTALVEDNVLASSQMRALAEVYEEVFEADTGKSFPQDPTVQLGAAVEAVLKSWSGERATSYRRLNNIPETLGTAITVQTMAFGNLGPASGAGVGFTRNPSSGSNEPYIDYLPNAQGEDVVSGRRAAFGMAELEQRTPAAFRALVEARAILEREFRDMMDFEFTVEDGRLLMLQARSGKRTPLAALRIAKDLVDEQVISPSEAAATLSAIDIDEIEEVELQPDGGAAPIAWGTPAGIGIAVGVATFDPGRVAHLKRDGSDVILFRQMAETADISAYAEAAGLVTAEGARTSHAAVVARQLGKPCIVACSGLAIDSTGRSGALGDSKIAEGDIVSIDGATGAIYKGKLAVVTRRPVELIEKIRGWRQAESEPRGSKAKRSRGKGGAP